MSLCKGATSRDRRHTPVLHRERPGERHGRTAGGRNAAHQDEQGGAAESAGVGAETQTAASGADPATNNAAGEPVSSVCTGPPSQPNKKGAAPSYAHSRLSDSIGENIAQVPYLLRCYRKAQEASIVGLGSRHPTWQQWLFHSNLPICCSSKHPHFARPQQVVGTCPTYTTATVPSRLNPT